MGHSIKADWDVMQHAFIRSKYLPNRMVSKGVARCATVISDLMGRQSRQRQVLSRAFERDSEYKKRYKASSLIDSPWDVSLLRIQLICRHCLMGKEDTKYVAKEALVTEA